MDDKRLSKLMRTRELTPNVPPFERQVYNDGKRAVAPATQELRSLAQNIIDETHEHRHLRSAKVLLLVESSESIAKRLAKGERITAGKAFRSSPIQRVLASSLASEAERRSPRKLKSEAEQKMDAPLPGFDFIVKLSGDWLTRAGYFAGEESGIRKALALIDHELSHCAVKIAGEFVDRGRLAGMVKDLGEFHLETCDDIKDDKNRILVRYQVCDVTSGKKQYAWKLQMHDLEEFCGVAQRWGAWYRELGRLTDILVQRDGDKDASLRKASA